MLLSCCLAACSMGQQAPQQPPVPVTVAKVVQKDVPVQITDIGRVDSYSTVSVRSQISAEVTDVCFKEGQDVKKGFCLFRLDCRPYEAALRQSEAYLAKDTAQAANAQEEVKRYTYLVEKGYVVVHRCYCLWGTYYVQAGAWTTRTPLPYGSAQAQFSSYTVAKV